MVKTQVQFPDHLYRQAKRVAVEQEMSFAEVVRRGLEIAVQGYPPGRAAGEAAGAVAAGATESRPVDSWLWAQKAVRK